MFDACALNAWICQFKIAACQKMREHIKNFKFFVCRLLFLALDFVLNWLFDVSLVRGTKSEQEEHERSQGKSAQVLRVWIKEAVNIDVWIYSTLDMFICT